MSLTSYRAAPPRVGGCGGWIGRPGGDRLSRALRHSTMGAGGFHGRVRDGIGCGPPAVTTRSSNPPVCLGRRARCWPAAPPEAVLGWIMVLVRPVLVMGEGDAVPPRVCAGDDFRAWWLVGG